MVSAAAKAAARICRMSQSLWRGDEYVGCETVYDPRLGRE